MRLKIIFVGLLLTLILLPATVLAVEPQVLADAWWEYVPLEEPVEAESVYYITTARVNLRPTPCTGGERLALVSQGQRVEVLSFGDGEWFEVIYNGIWGFMTSEFLREVGTPGVTPAVGRVELLEWSEARNVVTLGTIFTVIDVRSGLSWEMASFSNGNHADVETITADDTATMLQAFGQWQWTPRPVLVAINGRTIAASINGMPHAGSTRSGNNMNGHVCLHFLGSSTHRSAPSHVRAHQNAVQEAFNTASTW